MPLMRVIMSFALSEEPMKTAEEESAIAGVGEFGAAREPAESLTAVTTHPEA